MRMLFLALFAACLLADSASAQTGSPAQAPTTDAKPAPSDDKQLICVDQDPGSGTRLAPRRVCHTQEQWNKLRGKSR